MRHPGESYSDVILRLAKGSAVRATMGGLFQKAGLRPLASLRIKRITSARILRRRAPLAEGKPHDDFCGFLPIGFHPQIKIGNDLIESIEEKRNRLRIERSVVTHMRPSGMLEPPGCGRACSIATVPAWLNRKGVLSSRLRHP